MASDTSNVLRVSCEACGAKFKVPASKAGKKGPCPKCKAPIVVPMPEPEPVLPAGDVDWNMLADAAESAPSTERDEYDPVPLDEPVAAAPRKRSALADLTPEQRAALARRAEQKASASRMGKGVDGDDNLWGFPSFLMGLTLAAAGSLVGAGIWFALLAGTGTEMRFLAVLIGLLAGGGMMLGYQKGDAGTGMLTACMAVGGILLAKMCVVWFGASFFLKAQARNEVSEAEKEVAAYYEAPIAYEEAKGSGFSWIRMRTLRDQNIAESTLWEMPDFRQDQIMFPIHDEAEALSHDEALALHRRYEVFEYRVQEATGFDEESEEEEDALYDEMSDAEWEKYMAAQQEASAKAQDTCFVEVAAMDDAAIEAEWTVRREKEREATLAALEEMPDAVAELIDEGASDEEAEEQLSEAARYSVFRPMDAIFIFIALGTAFKMGAGFGND